MENAKHTSGPWIVSSDRTAVLALTPVDMDNQQPCPKVVDCASGYDAMEYDEAKANARLIAAAPDLLAALERILYAHDNHGNGAAMGEAVLCQHYASMARAAIAKSTGSQP